MKYLLRLVSHKANGPELPFCIGLNKKYRLEDFYFFHKHQIEWEHFIHKTSRVVHLDDVIQPIYLSYSLEEYVSDKSLEGNIYDLVDKALKSRNMSVLQ